MPTQVEITLEEHESPSPTSSTSSGPSQDKKKEEVIQKVVRKRAVCRSKFRHRNLELFKLGNSIPTSLCKTKEPYNVCTGRNLQMCCETQQNGKKDENCSSSSLTQAIINSIEGSKNSDPVLSTSISLNNEKKLKPKTLNNEVDKTISTGRHNLPLIISELTERKTNKFSNNKPKSTPENNETVIKKTEPISIINRRKSITQRRKTVTGSETTLTSQNEIDIRNVESRRNKLGNPLAEGRRGPVNNTVPQTNPICLSPEDLHINRRRTAANNKLDLNDQGIINRKTQEQRPHPQLTCYNATDLRNMIDIIIIHMTHEFTIDNLMTLNRYYLILHPYMFHPNCKEELRTSIFKSLTQVVLYLSDKLFGTIEDVRLNSYVTSIMQCDLLKHRQLLEVYVPKLNRYRHDDAWMMDFIRMLSQPSMTPAVNKTSNNRHRRGPEMVVNNPIPQNSMYTEPLPAHPFLHSRMANNNMYSNQFLNGPQNLFQTLQPFPPPLPYDVHRFTNPLPGNLSMEYLINLSDYQQFNINRSKNIRSDGSYLADNRCVPPHYNHMLVSNGNRHPVNDIDIMHPRIPGNAANYAPVINKANEVRQRRKNVIQSTPKEPPPLITSVIQDVCYQQRSQIQPPNISQVPSTVPNSGKLMSRQNSESSSTISTVSETNVGPDVEDHLQTNVILNQSRVMDTDVNTNILDSNKPVPENLVVERITQINLENTNTSVGRQTKKSDNTFLYKDCAMEITRAGQSGNSSRLKMVTDTRTKNDTIIERIDVGRNCDSRGSSLKSTTSAKNGEGTTGQEMEVADTDTDYEDSIEEVKVETSDIIYVDEDPDIVIAQFATMPRPKVASPTSMKGVQSLKRKDDGSKEQKEKKLKRRCVIYKPGNCYR
ncbi:hypothetical protein NQ317_001550 [Molorchus minor]|uniref:Uncharacterized protein n=1 Tax=Molorchus minor TaxID=1323400 RepID=A0ABQ9J2U0_9CUCU|nr:hypothetical protein NQ317_001550 [Molorchus minor]